MKILLATNNEHKIKEFKQMMPDFHFLIPKDIRVIFDPDELGNSFIDNALLKAKHLYTISNKLYPVLADDSGLCIRNLNNEPGIFSARYGDTLNKKLNYEEKMNLVLKKMETYTTMQERSAHFTCALAFIGLSGNTYVVEEYFEGHIAFEISYPLSFGYDPIFYLEKENKTLSQISLEEKNKISHRAKAFKKLNLLIK